MIAEIEDHLIERIKAHFNRHLRTVESLPSDFDSNEFERVLRSAPGVFIVFGGGPGAESSQNAALTGQWSVIVVTDHASGELARRRGNQLQIGAYEIIERVVAILHDHNVPDSGPLKFKSVENLFSGTLDAKGVSMYSVMFSLPMTFDIDPDLLATLDDFIQFESDTDLQNTATDPDAHDSTTLEQSA